MKSLGQGHRGINRGVQSWRKLADPGNQPHKSRGVGDTEEMEGGVGVGTGRSLTLAQNHGVL